MIQIFCPNCFKSVSVPDEAAGTSTPCPSCGTVFPVPARYNPVVAAPPTSPTPPEPAPMPEPHTPPGFVPPAAPLEAPLPPEPPVPGVPPGYRRSIGFSVSPKGLAWVPAVGLTLILLLSVFDWVGSYVGGTAMYAQSGWRALTGYPYRNAELERRLKAPEATRAQMVWPDDIRGSVRSDWEVMLPYFLALVLAVAVAWAERLVATVDRRRLPPSLHWVAAAWPYRIPVLAGLATAALLLVLIQAANGFGLERYLKQFAGDVVSKRLEAQAGGKPVDPVLLADERDQELARFNLERTTWFYLVVLLHLAVVLAMVGRAGLERRGNKPPPRVVFQY
ncbi:MAG: hypothetical protein K2X87_11120 [Gemmataceae bacterium]|nr:hypothetical protein [Gemmataceae bacterium]